MATWQPGPSRRDVRFNLKRTRLCLAKIRRRIYRREEKKDRGLFFKQTNRFPRNISSASKSRRALFQEHVGRSCQIVIYWYSPKIYTLVRHPPVNCRFANFFLREKRDFKFIEESHISVLVRIRISRENLSKRCILRPNRITNKKKIHYNNINNKIRRYAQYYSALKITTYNRHLTSTNACNQNLHI